jgi:hypothetical protein
MRSPGQPLDAATRAFFEPRFGHDFSHVRVHADARAAASAAAVNAHAYTLGSNVTFASGQYSPSTEGGRNLLAHELTHVIQQSGQAGAPAAEIRIGPPGDAAEHEADRIAQSVVRSDPQASSARREPLGKNSWSRDVTPSAENTRGMVRRKVVVNPANQGADILRQFNFICPDSFSLVGSEITQHCDPANKQNPRGCECLCDATHDPKRQYTISVKPANRVDENVTLSDGSPATVTNTDNFPETHIGTNPEVIVPTPGSAMEFGSFKPDGKADWADDWRILEHEFCGHARTGGGAGPIGNRPLHDFTIDIENAIAAEHSGLARGHFTDLRQGESFQNPVGDRSKVRFKLKDGIHFEAPPL